MKNIFALLSLLFLNQLGWAGSVESANYAMIEDMYSKADYPSLEYHVESAIPGRCLHKFDSKKHKPSAILVSFGESGFEVAPIALKNQPLDFFDDMTWAEIFVLFPEVASQFYEVKSYDNFSLMLTRKTLFGVDHAFLRENSKFFIMKTYKNGKFYRFCYYQKNH